MQKHLKKVNLKKRRAKKKKPSKFELRQRAKKLKTLLILKRILKYSRAGRIFSKYKIRKGKDFLKLTIRVMPNNIFCNLGYYKSKHTLKSISSGIYKLKTSKKNLRYNIKIFVLMFLKKIKEDKIKFSKFIAVKLIAPIRMRSQIIKLLSRFLFKQQKFKKTALIEVVAKKVFNGCRPIKAIRKKRKRFRLSK